MSKKPLLVCFLVLSAAVGGAQAQSQDPVHSRVPLGKAIGKTAENEAKNPQSQGLDNANSHQARNQERFIEKHVDHTAAAERVERAGGVERPERPERPERVERPELVRPADIARANGGGRFDRAERPGVGKGR